MQRGRASAGSSPGARPVLAVKKMARKGSVLSFTEITAVGISPSGLFVLLGRLAQGQEPDEKLTAGGAVTRNVAAARLVFFKPLRFGVLTASVIGHLGQGGFCADSMTWMIGPSVFAPAPQAHAASLEGGLQSTGAESWRHIELENNLNGLCRSFSSNAAPPV